MFEPLAAVCVAAFVGPAAHLPVSPLSTLLSTRLGPHPKRTRSREESPTAGDLTVGLWVVVKGATAADGRLRADIVTVNDAGKHEEIIGDVSSVGSDPDAYAVLMVDGQPAFVTSKSRLRGLDISALDGLAGSRVSVEGYWRSPEKFSVRELEVRSKGRDRLEGRIDAVSRSGGTVELRIMGRKVAVGPLADIVADRALADYTRADETIFEGPLSVGRELDDDDDIPGRRIAPGLFAGLRVEWQHTDESNFDLDQADEQDRVDDEYSARAELRWVPSDRYFGLVEYRHGWRDRFDEDDGRSARDRGRLNEAHLYVRDVLVRGLDLQVGRQDFDEQREWLYDENLDAFRVFLRRMSLRLELFAAGVLFGGDEREADARYYGALLGTETSSDWSLSAYAIHAVSDLDGDRHATHLGLRGLGEFVDDHESWGELSFLTGTDSGIELTGWAFDFGNTWSPPWADRWYVTAALAYGSGDRDTADGKDATFRQTGLHDNNAKFGGVTSFRYYGELFEPELANLRVASLGIGRRFGRRESVDLVFHKYHQDFAQPFLVDAGLDTRPSGVNRDLGWEVDLVFGSRSWERANVELVFGRFDPGPAFPDADHSWIAKIQIRAQL